MKIAILAGGFGTRFSEETINIPKPMITIGDKPILWHIMKIYSFYGFNEFVILGGYKSYIIKEYFANYFLHQSDVVFCLMENKLKIINNETEPWIVTILDTGLNTMTGGRIKRAENYLKNDTFMLTYGDGVSDINLNQLLSFHKSHGKMITMTTVQPEGRFGAVEIENKSNMIKKFIEKPKGDGSWINAGFFVCEPNIFENLAMDDQTVWEHEPLEKMAQSNQLYAYKHFGFWKPIDILRDKIKMEEMWRRKQAPWKLWK